MRLTRLDRSQKGVHVLAFELRGVGVGLFFGTRLAVGGIRGLSECIKDTIHPKITRKIAQKHSTALEPPTHSH